MDESQKKEELFIQGLNYYHKKDYFESHESWEELWSDYYLEDRKFVQALIQLSVSFVHLGNNNIKGAKSLLNKSKSKFKEFTGVHRGINVKKLLEQIEGVMNEYNNFSGLDSFDWNIIPSLD